jgi:hypothetical protein
LKENSSLSKLSLYDFQIQHNQIIQKRKKYLKELKQVKQDILFYHARQQEAFKIRQELVEHAQKIMLECNSGHVGHFALHKKNDHNAFAKSAAGEIAKLMQKNEVEAILLKLFKPFGGGHAILVLPKEKQIFDIQHGTMFYKSVEELMVDLEHYLATSRQYIKVFVHCIGEVSKGAQLIPV